MKLTDYAIRSRVRLRPTTLTVMGGILLLIGACADPGRDDQRRLEDTLTRRQRDSIIGASKLPGAKAVQRALDAADSASARTTPLDSLLR